MNITRGLVAFAILGTWCATAQEAQTPIIRSTSQEVLLDMIVRDKKGHVVRDLKPGDIEINDAGQTQKITSFRLVERSEANGASTTAGKPLDPLRQVRLVTFAFDNLHVDGRNMARQAALDLLKNESGPNLYFGVFTIDQRLAVLQQYTSDKDAVKQAVIKATAATFTVHAEESEKIANELKALTLSGQTTAPTAPANGAPDTGAIVAAKMAQMTLNMLQFSQSLDRTQQGRATIFSLLSLITEQYRLPGRKTLLYFSEGLFIPENLVDAFKTLISVANRANVSVYSIDAKGLVTSNQNSLGAEMLGQATAASKKQLESTGGEAVTPDQAKALDLARDSTRGNLDNSLADLSDSTGGFLIANTNDLRVPLRRVGEDINTYYELSYTPHIEKYDGSFRAIAVRAARSDLKIQARSGYFAVPMIEGQQVLPYEMPMLNALNSMPLPQAIPFHAAALHFLSGRAPEQELTVEVPLNGIGVVNTGSNERAHFAVLALVKNAQGEIVQKLSQDVPFQFPANKLDAFRTGHFTYSQHVSVPPGRYTLETAVLDREADKVSARKSVMLVAPAPQGIGLSSIALIRRVDQEKAADPADPFTAPGGKITPALTDTIKGGPGARLSTYFVIYPQPDNKEKPQLYMDFLQDGKLIARGTPDLPAADSAGRIPYVAVSPIETLKPGQYEVRATVKQGTALAQEKTYVTIE